MQINKTIRKSMVMGLIILSVGVNTTNVNAQSVKSNKQLKSNEQVAELVIKGKYGNGETRKKNIAKEGYDYKSIQTIVNNIMKGNKKSWISNKTSNNKKSVANNVKKKPVAKTNTKVKTPTRSSAGRMRTMQATAYSTNEKGMGRYTANGTDLHKNSRVIAVDPRVIPLGSTVEIEGYGRFTAADTGGAIKGNRIDIHFNSVKQCINFGRRNVKIKILD